MYKFQEGTILEDVKKYIDNTYQSHYAKSTKQTTEIVIDQGHGTGFCMGNILKYAQRYGKKEGHNKNDLMKVIHYAIIQLSQDHYNGSQVKQQIEFDHEDMTHDVEEWIQEFYEKQRSDYLMDFGSIAFEFAASELAGELWQEWTKDAKLTGTLAPVHVTNTPGSIFYKPPKEPI